MIKRFIWGISFILCTLGLGGGLCAPFISPKQIWIFSFFNLGFPIALFCSVVLLILALRWTPVQRYASWKGILAIGIGLSVFQLNKYIGWPWHKNESKPRALGILTYNVGGLSDIYYHQSSVEQRVHILDSLKNWLSQQTQVDIFCFQEVDFNLLSKWERSLLPATLHKSEVLNVIYSRLPVIARGQVPFAKTDNSVCWIDVQSRKGPIRIYNVHLQSTFISTETKLWQQNQIQDDQEMAAIRTVLGKLKYASQKRAAQADLVYQHAAKCPHPSIIVGDFNDTPQSYTYRVLVENRTDAFRSKGYGISTTYTGLMYGLRIDYVFPSKEFTVFSYQRVHVPFSDHHPVIVSCGLR